MAIAAALPGYNDLGRSVTHTFLSRNRFYEEGSVAEWFRVLVL